MKVFVTPLADSFENKARAKHLLQACAEFGARPTAEGPDNFSVQFQRGTSRPQIQQFLEAVQARGVSLETTDASALAGDAPMIPILETAIARRDIPTERLLCEDIFSAVDAAGPQDADALTPKQQDEAYEAMREMRGENEDFLNFRNRNHQPDDPFGVSELDAELERMRKDGTAAKYHRDAGF